ncbi:MAG: hypothetical protein V3U73_03225 [bacterium]
MRPTILALSLLLTLTACSQGQGDAQTDSLARTKEISVGKGPDALFVTPDEDFLYVANVEDTHVSVIDTRKDSVVYNIDTVDYPWGFVHLGNSNFVAVSGWDKGIDIINFTSHKITQTKRYAHNLGGITATRDGKWIFVVATEDNKVLKIATSNLEIVDEYKTGTGPDGIGISKDNRKIYVTNTKDGTISVINVETKFGKTIFTGGKPELVHPNKDHSLLYISNFFEGKVHVVDTETDQIIHELTGLDGPEEAVLSRSGEKLYVVNFNSSLVSTFDARSYKRLDEKYAVGAKPIGLVPAVNDSKLYVTNYGDNTVSVITLKAPQ